MASLMMARTATAQVSTRRHVLLLVLRVANRTARTPATLTRTTVTKAPPMTLRESMIPPWPSPPARSHPAPSRPAQRHSVLSPHAIAQWCVRSVQRLGVAHRFWCSRRAWRLLSVGDVVCNRQAHTRVGAGYQHDRPSGKLQSAT